MSSAQNARLVVRPPQPQPQQHQQLQQLQQLRQQQLQQMQLQQQQQRMPPQFQQPFALHPQAPAQPLASFPAVVPTSQVSSGASTPQKLKTPAWREVHEKVLSEKGLWQDDEPQRREASRGSERSASTPGQAQRFQAIPEPATQIRGTPERRISGSRPVRSEGSAASDAAISSPAGAVRQGEGMSWGSSTRLPSRTPVEVPADPAQLADTVDSQRDFSAPQRSPAETARLQREVQEMRGEMADTRKELLTQSDEQKKQTAELRKTLSGLESESARLLAEQNRQASLFQEARAGQLGESSAKLSKQVNGMAASVQNQEQRFSRLEQDVNAAYTSQRSQLQEALSQSRQLAKSLEDESSRRKQQFQALFEQVQSREVPNIQQELVTATSSIQAHSRDWAELARQVKAEISTFAHTVKVEREVRAMEAANQRADLIKLMDQAKRQGAMEALDRQSGCATSSGDLAQDMASRAGATALRRMVDLSKTVIQSLETSLIQKAGMIAGVFHTWRAECALLKAGRRYHEEFARNQDEWEAHLNHHRQSFEEQLQAAGERVCSLQDQRKKQTDLLMRQWFEGEAKGLLQSSFLSWAEFAKRKKQVDKTAVALHKSIFQWLEGQEKGLLHSVFAGWKHQYMTRVAASDQHAAISDLERKHQQELDQVMREAEEKVRQALQQAQNAHSGIIQDLSSVLSKWEKGNDVGVLLLTWQAWKQEAKMGRIQDAQSKNVQLAISNLLAGTARGLLHSCFRAWSKEALHSKHFQAQHAQLEQLLEGERAKLEQAWKELHDEHKRKQEEAHNAVVMTVEKWEMGSDIALRNHVFQVWSKHSMQAAADARRAEAVHMTILKWSLGNDKGDLHCCFLHWKNLATQTAAEKKHKAALEVQLNQLQSFVADERKAHELELQKVLTEAELAKQRNKEAVQAAAEKWAHGDKLGTLSQVLHLWVKVTSEIKVQARNRQAVHDALLRAVAGDAKAAVQMAFVNWLSLAQCQRAERREQELAQIEKAQWEAKTEQMLRLHDDVVRSLEDKAAVLGAKAHATVEIVLKQLFGGDSAGILSSVFTNWKRETAFMLDKRRKSRAVKDTINRVLEGETRGIMHSNFSTWSALAAQGAHHRKRIEELEKQLDALLSHHELRLTKYALLMATESMVRGMVFAAWRESLQGMQFLEKQREREVALEAMRRHAEVESAKKREEKARTLAALGFKDNRLIMLDVFLAWSYYYLSRKEKWTAKAQQNNAMLRYSEFIITTKATEDNNALLASSFMVWHKEARIHHHEALHENALQQLDETGIYVMQQKAGFEEQLAMAYKQIDQITETLQKELQTKEELAGELREAYEKMRQSAFLPSLDMTVPYTVPTAYTRPSSGRARSVGGTSRQPLPGAMGLTLDTLSPGLSPNSVASMGPVMEPVASSPVFPAGRSTLGPSSESQRQRVSSPLRCDWDLAVLRMREEGLVHLGRGEEAGQGSAPVRKPLL